MQLIAINFYWINSWSRPIPVRTPACAIMTKCAATGGATDAWSKSLCWHGVVEVLPRSRGRSSASRCIRQHGLLTTPRHGTRPPIDQIDSWVDPFSDFSLRLIQSYTPAADRPACLWTWDAWRAENPRTVTAKLRRLHAFCSEIFPCYRNVVGPRML